MKTTIKWGIIGLGKIAHKFADDLRLVPDAHLHAVASSDTQRAADFAQKFGVTHHFGSYEAILDCPDLDVIYIATPHPQHCDITLMCLERKIAVLCEKPMGMNAHEVRKMTESARQNQTFLMEAIWTRFIPSFQEMLSLIGNNAIGHPLSMTADFGFFAPFNPNNRIWNKDLGASALLDIGIYPIFLAQTLFGKPTKIQAMATMSATDIDANCAINLQYVGGEIALCHATILADTPVVATIYGEKGSLFLHSRFHHADKITLKMYGDTEPANPLVRDTVFELPFEGRGYHFEAAEVNNCLKNNQLESSALPHQFSLDLIETLDAVRREMGLVFQKHDIF